MDLISMSMEMSQISLQNKVDTSVLKLAMDSDKNNAVQVNKSIENMATDETKGKFIDATM